MPADINASALEILGELCRDQFEIDASMISEDTPLRSLGLDSLDQLELLNMIEEKFSIQIPYGQALEFQTVGDICQLVTPPSER